MGLPEKRDSDSDDGHDDPADSPDDGEDFEDIFDDAPTNDMSDDSSSEPDTPGLTARIWAFIIGIPTALWAAFGWAAGRFRSVTTTARYRFKEATVGFVMGTHPNTSRLLATAVVGSGVIAALGIVGLVVNQADTSASSGPVVRTLLALSTSPWVWIVAIVVLCRQLFFHADQLLARVTAAKSGFGYQTIRRLAEEAKRPDLDRCERVLVQSGDTPEQITEWLVSAFDGNGHEMPTFNPAGADDSSDDDERGETTTLARPETSDPIDVTPTDADDDSDPDFWTQLRLFRLELGSAVDLQGVLWRFLVPAGLTFVGVMLWLRIWIQLWFLPVVVAISVFAGGLYYWMVDLRHRRRLNALRSDNEPTRWTDLAILTKTVDVPETTMYYGYLDGNTYASEDKHELARTLADRAIDRLEGREPAPAIEETNAYLLKRYVPMLEAWEQEHERKAIMDQLIDMVADAPEGLLPRDILIDEVVEYDRRYVAWGLVFIGRGRDPDLVREVYNDLVSIHALAETPVTVKDTESGDERELIAVSKGDESFPPDVVQLRGEFSSLFGKQAFQTRYDAPAVDATTTPAPFIRPESHETAD